MPSGQLGAVVSEGILKTLKSVPPCARAVSAQEKRESEIVSARQPNLGRASACGWRIRIGNRFVCDRHVAGFDLIVRSAFGIVIGSFETENFRLKTYAKHRET